MNVEFSPLGFTRAVLFDLDGTLTEPFPGITRSIQYALERLGVEIIPDAETLRWCIGPPLRESFRILVGDDDPSRVEQAVAFYRERYGEVGLFENEVIAGVPELLADLRARGYTLHVATSKLDKAAQRIVEHFDLAQYFSGVFGSRADGSLANKTELIAHILMSQKLLADRCIMIGDRKHDLIGARSNAVAAIGVTYGYGTRAELQAEMPLAIAESPADVGVLVVEWTESVPVP